MKEIILPWPARELSPNARAHWAVKSKFAKVARKIGYVRAMESGFDCHTFVGHEGKLHIHTIFYAKTRNFPDSDNCLSSAKNFYDGIADRLGVNDKLFIHHPVVSDETFKGGLVVVRISRLLTECTNEP